MGDTFVLARSVYPSLLLKLQHWRKEGKLLRGTPSAPGSPSLHLNGSWMVENDSKLLGWSSGEACDELNLYSNLQISNAAFVALKDSRAPVV